MNESSLSGTAASTAGFSSLAIRALDAAREEVLWADGAGRLIYANPSACSALGYAREELLTLTVSDICPDLPAEAWPGHWQELKRAGNLVLEVRQQTRSGQCSLVELSATWIHHEGQEYACAFGRNITDRKRTEEELIDAKQQLETIFDTMQAGLILVNPHGIITFSNQRMADMLGCTLDDLIGSRYPDHVHPDQRNTGDDRMRRLIAGEINHVHHERHYIRQDGSDFWGHLSGRRHEDAQGNLISLVGVIADITEIKNAQHAIQKSEERYRTIIETMQDVYYRADTEGRLVMVSPSGAEMLGYDRIDQILGCSIRDTFYYDPEERDAFLHNLKLKGKISGYELTLKSRDGLPVPVSVSSHLIFDDDGTFIGVEGVYHDIRQFREAMDKLKASEEKFARAFSHAPVMITISEMSSGRCIEVNDRFCEAIGFSRQEVLGRSSLELGCLSPAERERMVAVFRDKGRLSNMEITMSDRHGRQLSCLVSVEHITLEGEDQLLSIILDITARKSAEKALQESELKYRTLFATLQDAIFMTRAEDGLIVECNDRLSGYTRDELIGRSTMALDLWADTNQRQQVVDLVRTNGFVNDFEAGFRRKDGTLFSGSISTNVLSLHDGTFLLSVIRDMTERKRNEEERSHMEQQLLYAQKLESLGVLAGGIAHDFNNILMTIVGNADLALMRINKESPATDNLHCIEQAAARAAELARQMLAYSGKGKFVVESIDLNRLLEEMLHMLEVSISKKAMLRLNLFESLPSVEADATQLRQIIMNLVINASEAIGDKSGVIAISTGCMECDRNYLKDVWLDENLSAGRYVYFEIADSGCGMTQETLAKIFDPFFTTKFTGRGLGMAAVLGIIRGHRGAIKIQSEPEAGTTFKVLLPASGKPADLRNEEPTQAASKGAGTVLLVDDEETIRDVGTEMLRELGFTVIAAGDGREAVSLFRQNPDICFAIIDLTMPHMDGEQCFRELRQLKPDIRIIISSGYNEQEVTEKFAGRGLNGFIQKPYRLSVLRDVITNLSG